jgi:hypothetical protein
MVYRLRNLAGMAQIPLGGGHIVFFDDEDIPLVKDFKWRPLIKPDGTVYAAADISTSTEFRGTRSRTHLRRVRAGRTVVLMHRVIVGLPRGDRKQVLHFDRDGLNNRRRNLLRKRPGRYV